MRPGFIVPRLHPSSRARMRGLGLGHGRGSRVGRAPKTSCKLRWRLGRRLDGCDILPAMKHLGMGVIFSASALHQRSLSISCTSNTTKAASQHSTQFCITLQETKLRLFTCRPAPLLPRRRTPSWAAVSDEHGLRWRPRVPPRDGGMFEADLNMGVFSAEHEMAKRNASLMLADLKD